MANTPRVLQLPIDEYNAIDAVRISHLKLIDRSPAAYRHAQLCGSTDTPALALGTAVHCAVLEPERFKTDYAQYDGVRRGRDWCAWQESHPCVIGLTEKDMTLCVNMAGAAHSHPVAGRYLRLPGAPETTLLWHDLATGLACKGRVDFLAHDGELPVVVGLKTTAAIGQRAFAAQAARLHYHAQWAWYRWGHEACTGVSPRVVEIVIEKSPPHDIAVYNVPGDVLYDGQLLYRGWLDQLVRCNSEDRWPGAAPNELEFELPFWSVNDTDDDGNDIDFSGCGGEP